MSKIQKLFCYVDESGQDTQGRLFIVSVLIVADDRDKLIALLETIEHETGKNRTKWLKTSYDRRLVYMQRVLELPELKGKVSFAIYENSRDYFNLTVQTINKAVLTTVTSRYKATILIDALPASQARTVGHLLHAYGVSVKKVRGVRRDENDALVRLVDGICGFVRGSYEGQAEMQSLFKRAIQRGVLKEVVS